MPFNTARMLAGRSSGSCLSSSSVLIFCIVSKYFDQQGHLQMRTKRRTKRQGPLTRELSYSKLSQLALRKAVLAMTHLLLSPSLHHFLPLAPGQQVPYFPLPSLRLVVVKIYCDAGVWSRRQHYQETHICSPTTRMCMGI